MQFMESEPAGGKRVLHKGIVQPSSLQSLIHDTYRPIDEHEAHELAERCEAHLRSPMMIQNYMLMMAPNFGIAVPRSGNETARDLICQADAMMYAAKPKAKSRT